VGGYIDLKGGDPLRKKSPINGGKRGVRAPPRAMDRLSLKGRGEGMGQKLFLEENDKIPSFLESHCKKKTTGRNIKSGEEYKAPKTRGKRAWG